MALLRFPAPDGSTEPAIWTGRGFLVGGAERPVLAYDAGFSNWTEDLTRFHEEVAGEHHYIDVASRREAVLALRRHLNTRAPFIMDIGCSSGFLLKELRREIPGATLAGADYIQSPLEALAEIMPGVLFFRFDLVRCPLPDELLNGVVLLNVLEHIQDDKAAMSQVNRLLRPGGLAVIEVPAGPELYDSYDKQLMHFRRYTMKELCRLVSGSGFDLVARSHLGALLYPGFWVVKRRNQRFRDLEDGVQRKVMARNISAGAGNPFMHAIMRFESLLRRHIYYPVGIRCLVTARKPA